MKKIFLNLLLISSVYASGFLLIDNEKSAFYSIQENNDRVKFVTGMKFFNGDVCFQCNDTINQEVDFDAKKAFGVKYDSIFVANEDKSFQIRYLSGSNLEELNLNEFFNHSVNKIGTLSIFEDLVYAKDDLTCTRFWLIEDTGGAHPMHFVKYGILDKYNKLIQKDFAFVNQEGLKSLISKKIRIYQEENNHNERNNEYFGPIELNNFYFDNLGIVFSYSPYELFSYASGYIKVRINYDEIDEFLSNDFKELLIKNNVIKA